MNVNQFSQQDLAAFINSKKADDSFISMMNEFVQSHQSVESDTHVVSVSNSEVQIAPGESIFTPETPKAEEVNKSATEVNVQSKVEPKSVKGTKGLKKPKAFKPKEVLSLDRTYYTLEEVAACFRIGISTMHKKRKEGLIVGFKLVNQWRFSPEQLDAFESRAMSTLKN